MSVTLMARPPRKTPSCIRGYLRGDIGAPRSAEKRHGYPRGFGNTHTTSGGSMRIGASQLLRPSSSRHSPLLWPAPHRKGDPRGKHVTRKSSHKATLRCPKLSRLTKFPRLTPEFSTVIEGRPRCGTRRGPTRWPNKMSSPCPPWPLIPYWQLSR